MYHNSGDTSDRVGYDFRQLKSIARVQVSFTFQLSFILAGLTEFIYPVCDASARR